MDSSYPADEEKNGNEFDRQKQKIWLSLKKERRAGSTSGEC